MKRVTVELIGAARIVAGEREISFNLRDEATWRDAIAVLARRAPGLLGDVIGADRRSLVGGYDLNLGGRVFVQDLDQAVRPPEDGRVTLMDASDI